MKGAIIGDIVGSVYEFNNVRTKDFPLLTEQSTFTDDTVMTVAVMRTLTENPVSAPDAVLSRDFMHWMRYYGRLFPGRGYGGQFGRWLESDRPRPYYSCGNGSAMRVSPVAMAARGLQDCERLARLTSEITHNHPDGICGAQAAAGAAYLALHGGTKPEIKAYVEQFYPLKEEFDLYLEYGHPFDETCATTIPAAVQCFLASDGFEDCIRNAVAIGGDSDTIAAIAGAIAEGFYGVPDALDAKLWDTLDPRLRVPLKAFYRAYSTGK